jgi:hypothetical protein
LIKAVFIIFENQIAAEAFHSIVVDDPRLVDLGAVVPVEVESSRPHVFRPISSAG